MGGSGSGNGGSGSGNGGNGNNGQSTSKAMSVDDTDVTIDYHGNWQLNFNSSSADGDKTSHSTNDRNASAFLSFYGTKIQVTGDFTAGEGAVSANYIIDNGEPVNRVEPSLPGNVSFPAQMLFLSDTLPLGTHNITINTVDVSGGRNYSLTQFEITQPKESNSTKNNVGAIVGGVLGALIFFLLLFLGVYTFWRRRRYAQTMRGRLPLLLPYARQADYRDGLEYPSGKIYGRMSSPDLDSDSKFTFDVHQEAPRRETRGSWVSASLPPSIVVNDRAISDWSSYKGSSVVVERSHFSPFTTTTFSPMAFSQPTPPPAVPVRGGGRSTQMQGLTTTSSASRI